MERRNFVKLSCNLCLLGAAGMTLPRLTGCSPAAYNVYKTNIIDKRLQVPLTVFDKGPLQFVRPHGWFYDIAVRKKEDNSYQALLLQCTHQDNQLTSKGNGYTCSLHGSQFDAAGNVTKGPAELPLKHYKTFINNNDLIIEVLTTT